jgi:hypothetical protein
VLLPVSGAHAASGIQWHPGLDSAAAVLCSPFLLQHTCPALGLLGECDTGRLVPTARARLEAALEQAGEGGSAHAALSCLSLAAFAADGTVAACSVAGLPAPAVVGEESPRPQPPAALLRLTATQQEQLQSRLLGSALQLVPAVLAAVDAALRHRLWPPTAGQPASEQPAPVANVRHAMARLGAFFSWLSSMPA